MSPLMSHGCAVLGYNSKPNCLAALSSKATGLVSILQRRRFNSDLSLTVVPKLGARAHIAKCLAIS